VSAGRCYRFGVPLGKQMGTPGAGNDPRIWTVLDNVHRLKQLEGENAHPKKLVAERTREIEVMSAQHKKCGVPTPLATFNSAELELPPISSDKQGRVPNRAYAVIVGALCTEHRAGLRQRIASPSGTRRAVGRCPARCNTSGRAAILVDVPRRRFA
jgi:hypothetical protein